MPEYEQDILEKRFEMSPKEVKAWGVSAAKLGPELLKDPSAGAKAMQGLNAHLLKLATELDKIARVLSKPR